MGKCYLKSHSSAPVFTRLLYMLYGPRSQYQHPIFIGLIYYVFFFFLLIKQTYRRCAVSESECMAKRRSARDDDDTFILSRLYLFNILRHVLCCFRFFLKLPFPFRCPFYASDLNVKNRFRTLTMSLFSIQFSVVESDEMRFAVCGFLKNSFLETACKVAI